MTRILTATNMNWTKNQEGKITSMQYDLTDTNADGSEGDTSSQLTFNMEYEDEGITVGLVTWRDSSISSNDEVVGDPEMSFTIPWSEKDNLADFLIKVGIAIKDR